MAPGPCFLKSRLVNDRCVEHRQLCHHYFVRMQTHFLYNYSLQILNALPSTDGQNKTKCSYKYSP